MINKEIDHRIIVDMLHTCQLYAEKMADIMLTEYEMELYEGTSRLLTEYFKMKREDITKQPIED